MQLSEIINFYMHRSIQKQLAFMLGRQQVYLELSDDIEEFDELTEIMSNTHLNNNFLALAREVIRYKSHVYINKNTCIIKIS